MYRLIIFVALFVAGVISASPCAAQTYKEGDIIEVYYLGSWLPATVVKTNARGEVLAEYTFATRPHQDVFKPEAVRAQYESGAIARGRVWSDPSGTFKVKASLLAVTDEDVTLRKQDMTEIKVALNKLSDGDKTYLKKLQSSMGLAGQRWPEPPPPESFSAGADFGGWAAFGATNKRVAIEPDPLQQSMRLKQGGCGFPAEDFFDRLGTVLPVGAADQWLLAAVENDKPSAAFPTRLFWVSLARQKVERRQILPPDEKLLDYHAGARRALTYNELKDNGSPWGKGVLTVWETSAADEKVKPIVRWYTDTSRRAGYDPWGRLIDGKLVLYRAERQRYIVWDVAAKEARWQTMQESFFAPDVVLSGGRKYLFIPEDKEVRVLEAATGKWLTALPVSDGCSSVAISDDGRQAAVLGRSTLTVWDLTTADSQSRVFQAEAIGTPFTATTAWVGNERIMADSHRGQSLFSLKNKMTLWHYDFDHNAVSEHWSTRVREICDRHLVYAATFGTAGQHGLAVGAVQLPGPRVDEAEAALEREMLYIVKPGTAVRIDVNAGEHTDRVTKVLEQKVMANGWMLSPTATIALVAEMKRGEQQTVNYRLSRFGKPETTESATFVPYIASLRIQTGSATAWSSGTSSGAPPFVRLREGETVQAEVDKWQKPRPEFYDNVKIPDRILDPKYRDGLGTTLVTNRGLIPKN
jgi:hypothetical protein